ncbi:MAG: 5'-3' exonuclease H3TH domain-containing protein [Candidatus Colwellbacteria bacterium]|nr:5'-3' exonuclease H3TH domain-containing protein [Candidatus Colwellbacteria bacterium]
MRTLLVLDANSLIHRAYHALPPLTDSANRPAGALYGLSSILIKLIREVKPEFVIAAYDRPEPTFRKKEFSEYKATRAAAADDLIEQIISSKELLKEFGMKTIECPGFEADDIIGTVAHLFKGFPDIERLVLLSGDLDILQLVEGDRVVAWFPHKGISDFTEYDEEGVIGRFGVPPSLLTDYKGLVGDKSDNIPGVQGVGPKTALGLIKEYGPLEDLYELSPAPKTEAIRKVLAGKDSAMMSKRLATISREAPIGDLSLDDIRLRADKNKIADFLSSKGFKNLADRVISGGL